MMNQLCFNICSLPSSFLCDSEVPNLQTHIKEQISDVLQYACYHWTKHMIKVKLEQHKNIFKRIEDFLKIDVLFWIEAMNLLKSSGECHVMLQQVHNYISKVRYLPSWYISILII